MRAGILAMQAVSKAQIPFAFEVFIVASELNPRATDIPVSEQDDENSWALFALAWRRKWIVLFLTAVGLGLGYLFYLKQTPVYESVARIFIVRDTENGPIDEVKISSSYDTVHEDLIRSPKVLEKAIKLLDIPSLPTLAPLWADFDHVEDKLAREKAEEQRNYRIATRMMGSLSAEVGSNYNGDILMMRYRSQTPAECPLILSAVADAYQDYQGAIYGEESDDTHDMIRRLTTTLNDELSAAQAAYKKFRDETPELLLDGDDAENPHARRARDTQDLLGQLESDFVKQQVHLESLEAAKLAGGSAETLRLMIEQPTQDDRNSERDEEALKQELLPLQAELGRLLLKLGPDHPQVIAVEEEISLRTETLSAGVGVEEEQRTFVERYLESRRAELKQMQRTIDRLQARYDDESEKAKQLNTALIQNKEHLENIGRLKENHSALLGKLRELEIVRRKPGTTVDQIYPPSTPYQVEPDLTTVMAAAGVLGMLAGMGLAFLIDKADRRFRSPDEIRTDFGLPVVGHIPVLPGIKPKKRKAEPDFVPGELSAALRTFHHPRGRIAEAYRAVRTALYFSTRGRGHQVIQVTSPSPGDGKSTLSGNLAISVANSGKKALLIDADFRRPRIHHLFGLDNSSGISSVIEGKVEIADAVQKTEVENLWIMSCGPRPDNPAELLSSRRFAELISLLREQYDLVIVDTPPVLAVTDPLNVVARVDGVLLVLRLTKSARAMGRRALDALDGMGANVTGIVINGVGTQRGGYGYGQSYGKYGYGYGGKSGYGGYRYGNEYGYDYRYSDGYGDDQTYYDDDEAPRNGKSARTPLDTQ